MVGMINQPFSTYQKNEYQYKYQNSKEPTAMDAVVDGQDRRLLPDSKEADQSGQLSNDKQKGECRTCNERTYQDGSNDPGVSFKTPTKIAPEAAASAVAGHERQHVVRERWQAEQNERKVLYQSVSYHTGICPECGNVYVSGGTTRTVTKGEQKDKFMDGMEQNTKGKYVDIVA